MNRKLPIVKEIVDYHATLGVVPALQKHKELNRVADALPKHMPASIMKFATYYIFRSRAIPGVAFDKKCQFMYKLMMEVSWNYK